MIETWLLQFLLDVRASALPGPRLRRLAWDYNLESKSNYQVSCQVIGMWSVENEKKHKKKSKHVFPPLKCKFVIWLCWGFFFCALLQNLHLCVRFIKVHVRIPIKNGSGARKQKSQGSWFINNFPLWNEVWAARGGRASPGLIVY